MLLAQDLADVTRGEYAEKASHFRAYLQLGQLAFVQFLDLRRFRAGLPRESFYRDSALRGLESLMVNTWHCQHSLRDCQVVLLRGRFQAASYIASTILISFYYIRRLGAAERAQLEAESRSVLGASKKGGVAGF